MRVAVAAALLAAIPAALLWAAVTYLSSVVLALTLVVLWYFGCCLFAASVRNGALLCLSTMLVLAATEGFLRSGILRSIVAKQYDGVVVTEDKPFWMDDPDVGYRLIPNIRVHTTKSRNNTLVYDVVTTTDENGFRRDGLPAVDGPRVMLLGDSFTFGEGLNDDETLGYFFKKKSFDAVNIGMPGTGPHQSLRQLQVGLPRKGAQTYRYIVLTVIDDHLVRANGGRPWLRDSPRFEVDASGQLVLMGNFQSRFAFVEKVLIGSRVVSMIVDAFESDSTEEERRFVGILSEIDRLAAAEYGAKLLVVYHAGTVILGDLVGNRAKMHELFRRAGVDFIDIYAALPDIERNMNRYLIPFDAHPTGALNEAIVDLIVPRLVGQ